MGLRVYAAQKIKEVVFDSVLNDEVGPLCGEENEKGGKQ
jgi:hypothetical protein